MNTQTTLGRATYSPEDNKLRFYPDARLSKEDYNRARGAGFIWAPKQELFVAPMWTPDREDLLIEWCGEIGDEDTSLVERAEQRAERFEDYSDKRKADADSAHKAVSAIADGIPLGQPILVGHHSERRARKDAERIQAGMEKAVRMWDQSKYWQDRAQGALRHAKYKQEPDVRARRIKGLEADKRKQERNIEEAKAGLRFWRGEVKLKNNETGEERFIEISEANREEVVKWLGRLNYAGVYLPKKEGDTHDNASAYSCLGNSYPTLYAPRTVPEVQEIAIRAFNRSIERCERWLAHFNNRLTYERAMLAEGGGIVADRFTLGVGGQVLRRGRWHIITKLNGGSNGKPQSVSVTGHWASTIPVEEIEDYKAPADGDFEKVKAATAKPPLCNYPGGEVLLFNRYHPNEPEKARFATMTKAEWDKVPSDYKGTMQIVLPSATAARHRVRICLGTYAKLPPPAGAETDPNYCSANRTHRYWPIYITDAKRTNPPAPDGQPAPTLPAREVSPAAVYKPREQSDEQAKFDALREQAKAGVQVVTAPQLFPTPHDLAQRMTELAGLQDGQRVLEPSAGTGAILNGIYQGARLEIVAVEISHSLCDRLRQTQSASVKVIRADFLQCNGDLGAFDVVLMNPPFQNGSDIKHIEHALTFLKPGGKLVAICANGPRQQEKLQPLADSWEALPDGTFSEQGTNVRTVLLTITKD